MPNQLKGRKVAFLATDGVEQVELTAPWNAHKQAGAEVVLVSDKPGEIPAMNRGRTITSWPSLETDVRNAAIDERRLDKMVEQSFPASDPLPGPIALG